MATVPPPGSIPPQPPPPQNDSSPPTSLSWEGEKMFNIYIYDYCFKRGYRKTARELMQEADIPPDSQPPINARQGLLFEWWSVFWVLFQAKSNGGGNDDALLYTQQQQQQQQQQRNSRMAPGAPAPMGPGQGHPGQPLRGQPMPPGMMNGMSSNPPGDSQMVFGTHGPQVNGAPGSHPPTPGGVSSQGQHPQHPGGPQQPHFNPMMQQRPMNGSQPQQSLSTNGAPQPQQQRSMAPNPNLPFHPSPTMAAHSPNAGPGMQQGPMPSQGQQLPGQQPPPMGNLGGPSPLLQSMNRGGAMLPPNGVPPPQGMMIPGPQQQGGPMSSGTPMQQFQQLGGGGRPPSRTNTPQMQGMMQQSPSMGNRQVMPMVADATILSDFARLSPQQVLLWKQEMKIADKDNSQLSVQEKRRILHHHTQRTRPPNAVAGPSSSTPGPNQQRGPQQPPQHQQPQRAVKRNSNSPGEEHESLPRTESSPPERKRVRRSPLEQNATIPKPLNTPMNYPQAPQQGMQQQQQQPGHPPQGQPPGGLQPQPAPTGLAPQTMMLGRSMGPQAGQMPQMVNGNIPPPPMNMQGQQSGQYNQMQGGMNPGQMGHQQLGGMMMSNQQPLGRTVPLHQVHQVHNGGLMQPPNAGSPAGQDPTFNSGQGPPGSGQFNNRMMPGKPPPGGMPPGPGGMMPPPSPGMGKDAQSKDKPGVDASPGGMGQQSNSSGGPSLQPSQQQQQSNLGPPPNQQPGTPASQPPPQTPGQPSVGGPPSVSPNNMMGGGPPNPMNALNGPLNGLGDIHMFSTDFMDFGTSFTENPLDFARDFGQWFNPDDLSSGTALEGMK
ncbi:hypothetical protein FA15DRAFT_681963 [Coprinopsis marcescibilis]|uniref:Uncharacterized protein n=1 Tax=Coprinopsis marcescibilis TaxID=230819 RepID=A0A5C3KNH4_COPMA|nr:hypothetical protein FA15DRAFT_681963 [Coprinopsis marcescibilis]